jgi:hypothetical protein
MGQKKPGTLHEDVRTFIIISRWMLIKMRNISDESSRQSQNTLRILSNFLSENRAFYELMWKDMVEPDRRQRTIQYGALAVYAG